MLIGLISDTHGVIRPEALTALDGVEMILHAGDVGATAVLRELGRLAPVHAVFGNVDDPILGLPQRLALELAGLSVHVSHGHELGSPTPHTLVYRYPADIIVFGHTHRPLVETIGKTLVINPGAAGPRRFTLQPSIALLTLQDGSASADIIPLGM